jgi:hypothetical protein
VAKPLPIDPATALAAARDELASREAMLAALQADRRRLLVAGTSAEVEKIDNALAAELRAITRCRDQVVAREAELARQSRARILADYDADAVQAEQLLADFRELGVKAEAARIAYIGLLDALAAFRDQVSRKWPARLPALTLVDLRFDRAKYRPPYQSQTIKALTEERAATLRIKIENARPVIDAGETGAAA